MKKLMLLIAIGIMLFSTISLLMTLKNNQEEVKNENNEYEQYLGKEMYGTEVASLINKVINQNERNGISKDRKGQYIENGENSIKIDFKMITIKKTYSMEDFYNNDMNKFLENFSDIKFKCIDIQHHKKTGKVSKIVIEQLEY